MKTYEESQIKVADEGVKYYKKAAVAQTAIGVSSIIQALAVVCIVFLLSSCMMTPVKKPVPFVVPLAPEPVVEVRGRIDAQSVIDAANSAGCDLAVLMYSEGKKDSKIMVQCAQGDFPPPPIRKGF